MDREYCLRFLIALLGGTTLLACGWWPVVDDRIRSARGLEKITWRRIWLPFAPAFAVASALCGWALLEPDPVPEGVPISLILMSRPFLLFLTRAAVRSGWALITDPGDPGAARTCIGHGPQACERMLRSLIALELARDEEARAPGIEGTDLAKAIIASARFCQNANDLAPDRRPR